MELKMNGRVFGGVGVLLAGIFVAGCNSEEPEDAVAVRDYVSAYDFDNAPLEDLPWEMGAAIVGPVSALDYVPFVARHYPDWNYVQYSLGRERFVYWSYIPENSTNNVYVVDDSSVISVEYSSVDPKCRLEAGELVGKLQCVDGVVYLDMSPPQFFQLKVVVLGYDDVNADGYMDVMVRRLLPGSACPCEDLVLSRKRPDSMFSVVDVTDRRICEAKQEETLLETGWDIPIFRAGDDLDNAQIYLVYPGESISDISRHYDVSEAALRAANGLSPEDRILAGQRLRIPER
jgi:hypothetical protein